MSDRIARAKLARAAAFLNAKRTTPLPALVFLTDDDRVADPYRAAHALPRGSLVIVRSRNPAHRADIAEHIAALAKEKCLHWLVAGDPALASRAGADGVHFPESMIADAHHWRALRPAWLITCAVHSMHACLRAARAGADAALLSPVFATESHAGGKTLGTLRARSIALQSRIPVYALGGIDAERAKRLGGARLAGLAAIGALAE
jgi:thiamine-phosphate pyrophosphorylase